MPEDVDATDDSLDESEAKDAAALQEIVEQSGMPVAIGGMQVVRASVTRSASKEPKDSIRWQLTGVLTDTSRDGFAVLGDLSCRDSEGWFAGCTVLARLAFREEIEVDLDDLDAWDKFACEWSGWAVHVLYDFAATVLRSHVALHAACDIEVPNMTPVPHFARARPAEASERAEEQSTTP